jgi:hypothetical protein
MLGVFGKGVDGAGLDQKSQKNSFKINLNILIFCITLIIFYYYFTKYIYIFLLFYIKHSYSFFFFHINQFYYNFNNFLKSTPLPNIA